MNKISLDFDGTLDQLEVQEVCRNLIKKGYEVHICTFRCRDEDISDELYEIWKVRTRTGLKYGKPYTGFNLDVFNLAEQLGIKEQNIHFTCYRDKGEFFENNNDFLFHLDDQMDQINSISQMSDVEPILYANNDWLERINKII